MKNVLNLEFEELPALLPGMVMFGSVTSVASYMVTYDTRHPEIGWTASRKTLKEDKTEFIGNGHLSFADAKEACSRKAFSEPR